MAKNVTYSPRLKNKVGIELDHLPKRKFLTPLPKSLVAEQSCYVSKDNIVKINENTKVRHFGTCGPEYFNRFTFNPDVLLDEMGIHPIDKKTKWLVDLKRRKSYYLSDDDYYGGDPLKKEYESIIFWDIQPNELVSEDGMTKIHYSAMGLTIDLPMADNYQDLLKISCVDAEILIPKTMSSIKNQDSRALLEDLGFNVREIDDDITAVLDMNFSSKKIPLNVMFYACEVPNGYKKSINTIGADLVKRVEKRKGDSNITGIKELEENIIYITYKPGWIFDGNVIGSVWSIDMDQEKKSIELDEPIDWHNLAQIINLQPDEYALPYTSNIGSGQSYTIALKDFPAPLPSGIEFPFEHRRPGNEDAIRLYLEILGFSNHSVRMYRGEEIFVGKLPEGWRAETEPDEINVYDTNGNRRIMTVLSDEKHHPKFYSQIVFYPEDNNLIDKYIEQNP